MNLKPGGLKEHLNRQALARFRLPHFKKVAKVLAEDLERFGGGHQVSENIEGDGPMANVYFGFAVGLWGLY